MELNTLLKKMRTIEASDLYLSTHAPASAKIHGQLVALNDAPLSNTTIKKYAYEIMSVQQRAEFEETKEMNMALSLEDVGRFRVNIFMQRADVSMVIRRIQTEIPSLETLGLPSILSDIVLEERGLILFVGATDCGKSTSLASLIDYRNQHRAGHIITIEDPIEFIHTHRKSIINQREIGLDTLSYEEALKNTLRQAPDVIMIGEIRSENTMQHAIAFSETGHLCLSTLHANNADQAFERIIKFFGHEKKEQILLDLSFNLRAIISQRLIPAENGKRIAAVEVLINTPLIASLIRRGEIESIKDVMERTCDLGMQTFDQSLEALYTHGKISLTEALRHADSKNNLRFRIDLCSKSTQPPHDDYTSTTHRKPDKDGLSLLDK